MKGGVARSGHSQKYAKGFFITSNVSVKQLRSSTLLDASSLFLAIEVHRRSIARCRMLCQENE